jgi:protein TonB
MYISNQSQLPSLKAYTRVMNSINANLREDQIVSGSWDSVSAPDIDVARATEGDAFQATAQLRDRTKRKVNPTQRIVGIVGALVLQAGFAVALIYGTEIKGLMRPKPITMVTIIEEHKPEKPVEPPPMAKLIAPDLKVVTLPPMAEITLPPPPVPLPPSPTAITTSNTKEAVTPPIAVVESYQVRLLRYLAGYRRYPPSARNKHQEGVVFVRFSMDRKGNVLSYALEKRSRHGALNEEALTVFKRANPLPPPPPELAGDPVLLIMPVEFSLR